MSANARFETINEQSWRMGFANLLLKENRDWWGTRRWWVNVIIWLLVINGIAALMLWAPMSDPSQPNAERVMVPADVAVQGAVANLVVMAGLFTPIGGVIVMQGTIIDEKKSGTAAWIMSKPASRTAFILTKLIANTVALVVIAVAIQWGVTYALFALRGSTPPAGGIALGAAVLALNLLFYMALTLLLGTLFNDRGAVIAIPIVTLFAAQFLGNNFPVLASLTPWGLIFPSGMQQPTAIEAMMGMPISNVAPILATVVWIAVFIGTAIWRFQREEF